MTEQSKTKTQESKQQEPLRDLEALMSLLSVLGAKQQRLEVYPTETHLFVAKHLNPCDAKESGLKFTFKDGQLINIHARIWCDYDQSWDTLPQ